MGWGKRGSLPIRGTKKEKNLETNLEKNSKQVPSYIYSV